MKQIIKRLISSKFFDFIILLLVAPAAYCLLLYRRIGSNRLPNSTIILKKIGLFPIRNHYYEPLFDDSNLTTPLDADRHLPGINLNDCEQIKLLAELTYAQELVEMNISKESNKVEDFYIKNGSFESGDAEFLYQLIRYKKPNRVIEIGSGSSTKIARLALLKNKEETGKSYSHICIEPYEQPWLEKLSDISVIRKKVEDVDFDWSNELKSGDILFVDSSHMIRPQGDVLKEYLEIFPSLSAGVYVHIHDIFTPKDYLKSWVVDDVRFWNEQYLLEALLSNTNRYEVVAALNYLKHKYYSDFKKVCPYLSEDREPGSFYFKTMDNKI
jgi:hypothetical protein